MAVIKLESLVLPIVPVVSDVVNGARPRGFHLTAGRTKAMSSHPFQHPMPSMPCPDYREAARSGNSGAAQAALRAGRLGSRRGVLRSRLAAHAREAGLSGQPRVAGRRRQIIATAWCRYGHQRGTYLPWSRPHLFRGLERMLGTKQPRLNNRGWQRMPLRCQAQPPQRWLKRAKAST